MKIFLTIIGGLIGATLWEVGGFIAGAGFGLLFGAYLDTRRELEALRKEVEELGSRVQSARPVASAAAPADKPASRPYAAPVFDTRDEPDEPVATSTPLPMSRPTEPITSPSDTSSTLAAARETWAPAASQPTAREPAAPSIVDRLFAVVKAYFTGGNTLVRVGAIILFFGVAFLLKYASEHTHVPIELRLGGVATGAIVLLILGWRLRSKRADYGLALQGTAVGVIYLTVFAALRLYSLLPATFAFGVLFAVCAFSAILAVLQNSRALAVLGAAGGFLAPILTSTGQGSHVALFSYYIILNLGIFGISWFKAWRPLNVLGFVFTFVISIAWGVLRYQPDLFASTEPFLIAFFLMYFVIGLLYASRQPPELRGYVDSTLVFGTPIVAFGIQSGLLREDPHLLAWSAVAASALYITTAWMIFRSSRLAWRVLIEAYLALGVVFATIAIPLALNGRWTSATWALEGAALVWVGCRQNRKLPRAFGVFVQMLAGLRLFAEIALTWDGHTRHGYWLESLLIAVAGIVSARALTRADQRAAASALFFWALLWWIAAGLHEIQIYATGIALWHFDLLFLVSTAVVCSALAKRAEIVVARWPALSLLPCLVIALFLEWSHDAPPLTDFGWLAWPFAFVVLWWTLYRHENDLDAPSTTMAHAVALWVLAAVVTREISVNVDQLVQGSNAWPAVAVAAVPVLFVYLLPTLARRIAWPLQHHTDAYLKIGSGGLIAFLAVWSLVSNLTLDGSANPLPYIPLLNPLDIAQAIALLAGVYWWFTCGSRASLQSSSRIAYGLLGGLIFIWLSTVLLRTVHHWAGVPFEEQALMHSTLVQTSLSIFWTVLALVTMWIATHRAIRPLWIAGAVLMAVVVLKLFAIDLSSIGTVERIVSFIAVGVLMLVIGYFAPLPPAVSPAISSDGEAS